jgi:hypothetical protein
LALNATETGENKGMDVAQIQTKDSVLAGRQATGIGNFLSFKIVIFESG